MRVRSLVAMLSLFALSSCGGDSSGPDTPYPAVAGVYNIYTQFDGLTPAEISSTGTVTLTQPSRNLPDLTGTMAMIVTIQGIPYSLNSVLGPSSVSSAGIISFSAAQNGLTWTFNGTIVNHSISGRHTLTDGTDPLPGNWSGTLASQ